MNSNECRIPLTVACNLCGSNEAFLKCIPRQTAAIPLRVVRCAKCDLMFVHPLPARDALLVRYNRAYFQCDAPLEGGYEDYLNDEPFIRKTFQRRLGLFLPFFQGRRDLSVLDVGCATGVFLGVMRMAGWQTSGLEVSGFAAEVAGRKGFSVIHGDLESASLPAHSFDLITMWDVIEHLEDPARAIGECFNSLKDKGILVMTTPDASALFAKLTGSYWLGFRSVGEHVYFFNRNTLAAYLREAGFTDVRFHAVGKILPLNRLVSRLRYYTRVFKFLSWIPFISHFNFGLYVNSGDTVCVVARKS